MRQLVSVMGADGKLHYFIADGGALTEFAIVNAGAAGDAAHAALSIANVGLAMTENFGLDGGKAEKVVRARALPPAPPHKPVLGPARRTPAQGERAAKKLMVAIEARPGLTPAQLRDVTGLVAAHYRIAINRLRQAGKVRCEGHSYSSRWYPT